MGKIIRLDPDQVRQAQKAIKKVNPDVYQDYQGWLRAHQYHTNRWSRCIKNWRYYFAHDPEKGYGQWPLEAVQWMTSQNRQLVQFNFIRPIVDAAASGLQQQQFEPDFLPTETPITSLTQAVKAAYHADYEQMDWDVAKFEMILGGLIHEGVVKFEIDRRIDHEFGNIALRACLPGAVIFDPLWKSWLNKECKECWKESWLTPQQIMDTYPKWGDRIAAEARRIRKDGINYGEDTGIVPFNTSAQNIGDVYRVIENYRMVARPVKRSYTMVQRQLGDKKSVLHLPIPDEVKEGHQAEWLNANVPDWQPHYTYEKKEVDMRCVVKAHCWTLFTEDYLENGETEIQIGCLPIKRWAAGMANGDTCSIVDSVVDPQETINYMNSLLQYKLRIEGGGGAQFTSPSGFKNQQEYKKFVNNRNDPAVSIELAEGWLEKDRVPAKPIQQSQFPNEAYRQLDEIINVILPNVSKITPAKLGQLEASKMPAALYAQLNQQGDKQIYTILLGLRQVFREIAEGYLMQAIQQYSLGNIPRTFTRNGAKEAVTLNERVPLDGGRMGIRNQAYMLRAIRHRVIISERPSSPSDKAEKVSNLAAMMQVLPPDRYAMRTAFTNEIIANTEQSTEEEKEELYEIGEMEMQRDKARLGAEMLGWQIQVVQLNAQLQTIKSGQMPALPMVPGAPGGAPSAPGQTPGQDSRDMTALPGPHGQNEKISMPGQPGPHIPQAGLPAGGTNA